MLVKCDIAELKDTRWYEYASRFLFGGAVTVCAGLIAKKFGPVVGGLFLAFPAIFPASASLIEKHEKEKKNKAGFAGTRRGRVAAGVDAAGTTIGCVGLLTFALIVEKLLPHHPTWITLFTATTTWAAVAIALWFVRKKW